MNNQRSKCSVEGCENNAEHKVLLVDSYPQSRKSFREQDYTCPYLCEEHRAQNEASIVGGKKPREVTSYLYSNQSRAQGHTAYEALPVCA